MKIVHVISALSNGGAEKLTIELCNEMSNKHDVTLLSLKDVESWMLFPSLINRSVKLTTLAKPRGFSPHIIIRLISFLIRKKPQIVNIHLDSTFNYFIFFSHNVI